MSVVNLDKLPQDLENRSPQQIVACALEHFDNIAVSFSGAEDVVLVDMATRGGSEGDRSSPARRSGARGRSRSSPSWSASGRPA